MAAQATRELQHVPQFKFSIVLEKLTFSCRSGTLVGHHLCQILLGTFAHEICLYGIYFYDIYIYGIYFYGALKLLNFGCTVVQTLKCKYT
jgi:hypothetical protein